MVLATSSPAYARKSGLCAFNLGDYFALTNTGKYNLSFKMNVIWFPPKWKGNPKTTNVPIVTLPPVSAPIEIKKP